MEEKSNNFISNLWERKVPQYLGTYFAIGFGLLQFLEFATERYEMGGMLVDKYLLVWLMLMPAIIVLIYFNGRIFSTSQSKVRKWPKYVVFGNAIVAFLFGGLFFNGKASAQNELVQLIDEEGNQVEVFVPSLNRIKTVACFQFINDSKDKSLDWWGTAFSGLLQLNLNQWPEFYASSQFELTDYYDVLGLEPLTVPSLGLQKEISQKSRNDYFSRMSFDVVDGKFVLKGKLYSVDNGNSIAEFNVADKSPFIAIDKLTNEIHSHYFGEFEGQKTQINMPASSLVTSNEEALKNWTLSGMSYMTNPKELDEVLTLSKKAIEHDPTCSYCQLMVGTILYLQTKSEEAKPYIKSAIKYGASLPKRFQFDAKEAYYSINADLEAYYKLLELRRKMFPFDFGPYERLWPMYLTNKGVDSAKVLINEAIDNGNLEKGLLALYDIQLANKEYVEAEKTLKRFTKEFPGREQDKKKFADLYQKQGELGKAKDFLLELEALNPLDTEIQTELAYLEFKNLEIEAAMARVNEGVEQATSLTDSLNFIWIKSFFYRRMGQIENSLNTISEYQSLALKKMPKNMVLQKTFSPIVSMYQSTANNDSVEKLIMEHEKYTPGIGPYYRCTAIQNILENDYDFYIDVNAISNCKDVFKGLGEGFEDYYDVLDAYNAGEYKRCIDLLEAGGEKLELRFSNNFLANMYLNAGMVEKTKELIQQKIDEKTDRPIYYFRMAELLEKESPKKAKKHLSTLFEYWSNADEDYILYQRAKELENRLTSL